MGSTTYTPDRVISRRLKEYDPSLFLDWDDHRERWLLMYRHEDGRPRLISVIQNQDGSFRQPDDRLLAQVWAADVMRRHGSASELMRVLDEKNHALEESQRRAIRDQIQAISREEMYRAFFGGPMIQAGIDLRRMSA